MVLEYKVGEEIQVEFFEHIEHLDGGDVFTDIDPKLNPDGFHGKQFIMSMDKETVELIGVKETVSVEHIKNVREWYRIGHVIGEYSTQY